jgi:hypothetical protein
MKLFERYARTLKQDRRRRGARGQSLVEVVVLFPIILIVLSGLIEFGFMLNEYLAILDSVRNAARFSSDGLYSSFDTNHNCSATVDFYRQTACLALQELSQEKPNITVDPVEHDDIVISVFAIETGTGVVARHPEIYGQEGWSYALDLPSHGVREQSSRISNGFINSRLDPAAPSTGLLVVEMFYSYDMKLALPWITVFVDDPLTLHVYSLMPLVSAEPDTP